MERLAHLPSDPTFEKQFAERKLLQTGFGTTEVVDIIPSPLKNPIPVLFAPGWRETPELEKACLQEVYGSGRRVITLVQSPILYEMEENSNFPVAELQKAKTLLGVLEAEGIEQADIITHSEGAINVAIAATMNPERFRHLVLVTPAGLAGKNTVPQIALGFARHLINTRSQQAVLKHGMKKRRYHKDVTFLKSAQAALQEGSAIASYDIFPLLIELRKQGMKIAVLFGETDSVFPIEKVKRHLTKHMEQGDTFNSQGKEHFGFDIFATKPGGHELYVNSHEIMQQVVGLLDSLDDH